MRHVTLLLSLAVRKGFLLGLVLLSACTVNLGSNDSPAVPTQDVSASNMSDNGSADTAADAGILYLEIVNAVNCLILRAKSIQDSYSYGDGTFDLEALPELQPVLGELSRARETAVKRLLENSWPDEVAAEVDLLARDWSKLAQLQWQASQAEDTGEFVNISDELRDFNYQSNSAYIRAKLGVGPSSETNQC